MSRVHSGYDSLIFLQGWYHLGVVCFKKRMYEEALVFLDKAIELNDGYYLAWFAKSQTMRATGKEEEADRCLKQVMRPNPDYVVEKVLQPTSLTELPVHTAGMSAKRKT